MPAYNYDDEQLFCCPSLGILAVAIRSTTKCILVKFPKLLLLSLASLLLLTSCSEKSNVKSISSANENFLRVSGDQIVNGKGDTIYLRGFGLGGMLHMENFIDGYTANEEAMRE